MYNEKKHINKLLKLIIDVFIISLISILVFFVFQYSLGYFTNENLNIGINFITRVKRIGKIALFSNFIYLITWYLIVYFIISFITLGKKVLFKSYIVFIIPLYIIDFSYLLTLTYLGRTWLFSDLDLLNTGIKALSAKRIIISKEFIIATIVLLIIGILLFVLDNYLCKHTDFYNTKINYPIEVLLLLVFLLTSYSLYNNYLYDDNFVDDMVYTRGIVGNLLYRYKIEKKSHINFDENKFLEVYNKYNNIENEIDENFSKYKNKNVIIIVEESFSKMYDEAFNYENTKFINSLKNIDEGNLYLYSNFGLTAYSEYEFFTGLSIAKYPKGDENYIHDSLIDKFNDLSYDTTSIHFCSEDVYRYGQYYKKVGFDNRYFKKDGMFNYEVGWLPKNDIDTFDNLLRIIKEKNSVSINNANSLQKNQLYYVVTTSAHDLENASLYQDYNPNYNVQNLSESENDDFNDYMTLIRKNDSDLEYLFKELEKLDEEYLVLVFGDHPYKFKSNFNSRIIKNYYKEKGSETQFFFWSNKNSVTPSKKDVYFIPYLYVDLLNYVGYKDNALIKFLKTFRKSILAMNDTTFYSVRLKSFIPYEDADDKEKELLYEYELIIESYFNKKYSNMFFE